MPVSAISLTFTERETLARDVFIPRGGKQYKSAASISGKCTATVDFEKGDTDRSSFYELWTAAVAVNTICVANGKAGAAFRLGESILSDVSRKRR